MPNKKDRITIKMFREYEHVNILIIMDNKETTIYIDNNKIKSMSNTIKFIAKSPKEGIEILRSLTTNISSIIYDAEQNYNKYFQPQTEE